MSGASWAAAAVVLLHLNAGGALPKEMPVLEAGSVLAERPVRVLIFHQASSLGVRVRAASAIEDADTGEQMGTASAGERLSVERAGGNVVVRGAEVRAAGARLLLRPLEGAAAPTLSGTGGWGSTGAYPGTLEFRAAGGLDVIEHVDLESYTAGVVAAELPSNFPLEAMKAQAVAARTYTAFHLDDHELEGADLCSQVHCHAYGGAPAETSRFWRAVAETEGQVLAYHGLLIDAQYHAACGGETATAWQTRPGKLLPYLSGVSDMDGAQAYCAEGHIVTWTKRFTYAEAQKLVARNLRAVTGYPDIAIGQLRGLVIEERSGTRVKWLAVETSTGTYRVMGDAIRWLFGVGTAGPSGLRSTQFDLQTKVNAAGRPASFVFRGRGHGHGAGMCQWGARGRALAGQSADEMLAVYYPGAAIERLGADAVARAEP